MRLGTNSSLHGKIITRIQFYTSIVASKRNKKRIRKAIRSWDHNNKLNMTYYLDFDPNLSRDRVNFLASLNDWSIMSEKFMSLINDFMLHLARHFHSRRKSYRTIIRWTNVNI